MSGGQTFLLTWPSFRRIQGRRPTVWWQEGNSSAGRQGEREGNIFLSTFILYLSEFSNIFVSSFICICPNSKIYLHQVFCICPNSQIYLYQVSFVSVQILKYFCVKFFCICPNSQIYLYQVSFVCVRIFKYICIKFHLNLSKLSM